MTMIVTVPAGQPEAAPQLAGHGNTPLQTLVLDAALVLTAYGLQTAWAINASTGSDAGPGTPAQPLRTMGEFNRRYANLPVSVAATLALQTNVTDAPLELVGTRFSAAASLTVSGTATTVASGTVTVVVPFSGAGNSSGYTVTTTGLDWTTVAERCVQFADGNVAWVSRVIDANNVEMGQMGLATSTFGSPPTLQAFVVQALSTAIFPLVNVVPGTVTTTQLQLQKLTFVGPGSLNIMAAPFTVFFSCALAFGTTATNPFWGQARPFLTSVRFCRFDLTTSSVFHRGRTAQFQGCVVVGTVGTATTFYTEGFVPMYFAVVHDAAPIHVSFNAALQCTACNIRNTASPLTLSSFGRWFNNNAPFAGANNTGVGITVRASAGFAYVTPGGFAKPTITAAGGDTVIGATARTYAQIPYVDLQLGAVPPVVTTLVGTPAFMVAEG